MATTPKKVRAASFKWPGEMEKEFCEALEEFPVLWDSYCPDYCVRDKRIAAQEAMGRLFHIPSEYFAIPDVLYHMALCFGGNRRSDSHMISE